jgi:hypothetical protein
MASTTSKKTTEVTTSTEATEVTAYGFSKIVNTLLKEKGLKELPPQMFYTYKNKGLIGTTEKPLTAEFATEWTTSYIERKSQKEAAKAAKTEAELNGTGETTESE